MKNYEVTFIVDPVLSGDEIKATAQVYEEMLKNEGCTIVHVDAMGLKPLAYPINKRSSGIYFSIEFTAESGDVIPKFELAQKRDERIMRFLTIALDKYGVKYNEDKRNGVIGKYKKKSKAKKEDGPAPRSSAPAEERTTKIQPPVKAAAIAAPVAVAAPAPVADAAQEPIAVAAPASVAVAAPEPVAVAAPVSVAQEEE